MFRNYIYIGEIIFGILFIYFGLKLLRKEGK